MNRLGAANPMLEGKQLVTFQSVPLPKYDDNRSADCFTRTQHILFGDTEPELSETAKEASKESPTEAFEEKKEPSRFRMKARRTKKRVKNGAKQVLEEELKNPRGFIEDGMWGGGYALIGLTPLMSVAWPLVPLAMGISFSVRSVSSFAEGASRNPEKPYDEWRQEKNRKIKRLSVKSILKNKTKTPIAKKVKQANQQVIQNELKNPHRYLEDGFWAGFAAVSGVAGKGAFFWPAIPIAAGLSFVIRHSAEFVTDMLQKELDTGDGPKESAGKASDAQEKEWETFDPDDAIPEEDT